MFAPRTATTCCEDTPADVSLAGSSVTASRVSSPPVRSAFATPSIAAISGTISLRAMVATCSSPSGLVAAIDEMTTGEALMFSAWTVGVAESGRAALASASWIAAVVSGTLVPNVNCVITSEIEFDDVDWISSRRGMAPIARSIGLVTCSRTSEEPAPGYGVTTVTTGNSMSGSSSCLRLPQAEIPATNRAAANRSVTLRLLMARRLRRLTTGSPDDRW